MTNIAERRQSQQTQGGGCSREERLVQAVAPAGQPRFAFALTLFGLPAERARAVAGTRVAIMVREIE